MGKTQASRRSSQGGSDIRDTIFKPISEKRVEAVIWSRQEGIVAGVKRLAREAAEIGLSVETIVRDGDRVEASGAIAFVAGTPKQISLAEDCLIGLIAKTSGIATAARKAVVLSRKKVRIVSGGWKKVVHPIKEEIREAIRIGGVGVRITDKPFVYLDKNYVRMFGSISDALLSVASFKDRIKVVQIRGETGEISEEGVEAARKGAGVVMVDTGNTADLESVSAGLLAAGLRRKVEIAFGGSISLDDIPRFLDMDVDILDIGRAIIDAPMLDIGLDVRLA
ncbi:MAG: hypothetical protein LUQ55_00770 [Methanomassiliicoccales archaeon]|nr:hypothetical protein [Methanomassiliicoccales archaeon]